MPTREHVTVRAFLIDQNGKVLVGRRKLDGSHGGQFHLIGGKVGAEDESLETAIKREVAEETGLDFDPIYMGMRSDRSVNGEETIWIEHFFVGIVTGLLAINFDELSEVIAVSEADLANIYFAFHHDQRLLEFFSGNYLEKIAS